MKIHCLDIHTCFASPILCQGNPPLDYHKKGSVMRNFNVFVLLAWSSCWTFELPMIWYAEMPMLCHCNDKSVVMFDVLMIFTSFAKIFFRKKIVSWRLWSQYDVRYKKFYTYFSRFAPCQWETSLQSNAVSHWLGANQENFNLSVALSSLVVPGLSLW